MLRVMKSSTRHISPHLLTGTVDEERHNRTRLVVKSAAKAGAAGPLTDEEPNHSGKRLVVKSAVKAGERPAEGQIANHSGRRLVVK